MRPVELVVAIAHHEYGRDGFDPPPHDPEHVKRRLVGPMDVLENDDGRRGRCELLEQPAGNGVRLGMAFHELQEAVAG